MKNLDRTKMTVLVIGLVAVVFSLIGALKDMSLVDYFFPLYVGLTLMGTVLLDQRKTIKSNL